VNYALLKLKARPWPASRGVTPGQRLRAALKRLERDYGLRCVACEIVQEPGAQPELIALHD